MKKKSANPLSGLLISAAVFLVILALFCGWLQGFAQDNRQRQRQALETALNRSILLCYTLEGRYPDSLEHILENYPVTYDETLFTIDYRLQAANILPEVTVLEKP